MITAENISDASFLADNNMYNYLANTFNLANYSLENFFGKNI